MNKLAKKCGIGERPEYKIWDNEESKWYEPIYQAHSGELSDLFLSQDGKLLEQTITGIFHESAFSDKYTVVRYSGLKDKNGKKIFEGDIVRLSYSDELETKTEIDLECKIDDQINALATGIGSQVKALDDLRYSTYEYDSDGNRYCDGCASYGLDLFYLDEYRFFNCFEVIGNIFENPNLLGND